MATPSAVLVSPRPRDSPFPSSSLPKVRICVSVLEAFFHLPQEAAARRLVVSLTSLKAACRKIGIKRWPYRRWPAADLEHDAHAPSSRETAASCSGPQGMAAAVPSPPVPDEDAASSSLALAEGERRSSPASEAPAVTCGERSDGWLADMDELGGYGEWMSWCIDCDDDAV
ncbi:hypothetical protein GUITHDRAFT_119488 [Guillardia theta CCMP2712]|uniref:RWP-RK domain-containing protein n=1 Tax=Guillardia theta (strain CCMP2712) TaxID=905079 RepID=L1IEK7_GUITC|nr:hypothetical protein GUITHDRAFT_119488 [Guillardia theta CCMP2712]EKX34319.1 hypothetical protein GUITHDRAFT_119488 [Guillardia theta CCMP2712]|eukprot:XP_005821299.1 hypothetical protein GUITHDRAFT_119488 [Guillardia theta CCMP2712]